MAYDIIHPPAAPAESMELMLSSLFIPPIAYTGIDTEAVMFSSHSMPLGGTSFLQSVAYICPAVM